MVRGQGKTEGLHRRTIPFSRAISGGLRPGVFLDRVGEVASSRTDDAGEAGWHLRFALFALCQGGPDKVRGDDKSSGDEAVPWLKSFDRQVDRVFFDDTFWADVAHEAEAPRRTWRELLRTLAAGVFDTAEQATG